MQRHCTLLAYLTEQLASPFDLPAGAQSSLSSRAVAAPTTPQNKTVELAKQSLRRRPPLPLYCSSAANQVIWYSTLLASPAQLQLRKVAEWFCATEIAHAGNFGER